MEASEAFVDVVGQNATTDEHFPPFLPEPRPEPPHNTNTQKGSHTLQQHNAKRQSLYCRLSLRLGGPPTVQVFSCRV